MNNHYDSNTGGPGSRGHGQPGNHHPHGRSPRGRSHRPGFDFWTVLDILVQRWHWPAIAGTLGMVGFLWLGFQLIEPKYTAITKLLRYETPGTSEFLKTTPLTSETFASLLTSPDLLRRVGEQAHPPIPPEKMVKISKVDPQVDSDIVTIKVAARAPQQAVELANIYANEAVTFTRNLQATQAAEVANTYLKEQVDQVDKDIVELREQFRGTPEVSNKLTQVGGNVAALNQALAASTRPSLLIAKTTERLQTALTELNDMMLKYTDEHPDVIKKRAQIQGLTEQIEQASGKNPGGPVTIAPNGSVLEPDIEIIRARLHSLEDARVQMASRQHEAAMFASNPPGIVRLFAPATSKTVESNKLPLKIGLVAAFGGFLGVAFGFLILLLAEATDKRIKTADDVKRVTDLPVLTTLGDLRDMEDRERTQWAFRTWTLLQGRLSRSQNHGLVCGVTSSTEGEGRSTWISMLAEAASLAGFRVLTIATQPSPTHIESSSPDQLTDGTHNPDAPMNNHASENSQVATISSNVLARPSQVTEQLTRPDSQPVVHIPLPGWVWNLERRKEWRDALQQWRKIDNLVIFVELPPASVPESVLLGSNLPNMVWLADSGAADAGETRAQLETLRNARCNLVGAVLNREPAKSLRTRFPRWLGSATMIALLAICTAQAQSPNSAPVRRPGTVSYIAQTTTPPGSTGVLPTDSNTNTMLPVEAPPSAGQPDEDAAVAFSGVARPPLKRAPWQEHLTLGAGDVVNIGLYGEPSVTRTEVTIAPDGRITYLEAQDVIAAGLTVDELRQKMDSELGRYRRAVRTIVTPVAYKSKKYFVLGQVVQRGVYTLERPTTVVEALAKAKGIQNGQLEFDTVDLADFQRAFLMRGNKRVPVDFEKLFQQGDLSQNVLIEPGDYLCFPSGIVNQIYVLGEVALPGAVVFRPGLTAVGGIAARGGFTEAAYKSHVLVVRGSLNHPETFVVNVWDITKGRAQDFKLQSKDIIYVSWRPFHRAEDLLDLATMAFIQSSVSSWVGEDILKP